MIKEVKISSTAKSVNLMKDFSPPLADLLEKIVVFNPSKRLTIEQILSHEAVKAFHKPEEEIVCNKIVSTSIDDNKKLTVDEYRKLIYGVSATKSKVLSSSLGTGSSSAKYLPSYNNKTTIVNSSTPTSGGTKNNTIDKPELTKKYSHEKLRTNTTYTKTNQEPFDPKSYEKPTLKYVRSNKDMTKPTEGFSHGNYKKFPEHQKV